MRRRGFFQALAAVPAVPALIAQQPAAPATPEPPPLTASAPETVAEVVPHFFNAAQFAALRKLSDILMPPLNGGVGGVDAGAPEFLDFLIGESPADRRQVYQAGLDALNAQAKKQFNKAFPELDDTQTGALLKPLNQPWTYDAPADPAAHFLRVAKQDIRVATVNSREYGAGANGGGRRFGGGGLYWGPLD